MCVCTGEAILLISIERMGRGVSPTGETIQNQKQLEKAGARGFLHTHIHPYRKEMDIEINQNMTISNQRPSPQRRCVSPSCAELEASKQEIAELSDEQLVEIAGGGLNIRAWGLMERLKD